MTTAPCSHRQCANEKLSERVGKMVAEQVLDDSQLRRVCANERGGAVVDYRSPVNAVEVKKLTVKELEAFDKAWEKSVNPADAVIPVPGLKKTWFVLMDTSAGSSGGRVRR